MNNPWAISRDFQSRDKEALGETENPKLDLYETASHLMIEIDLPGMSPNDIHMHILNNQFTLEGHYQTYSQKGDFLRMERASEDFKRVVDLPCTVDPERTVARYEKGVLTLELPKIADRRCNPIKIPIR